VSWRKDSVYNVDMFDGFWLWFTEVVLEKFCKMVVVTGKKQELNEWH